MCGVPMVGVEFGVDGDEAAEGEARDTADTAQISLEVCREDQFIWFDAGELDQLPQDLPDAKPTAEQQKQIASIMNAFDHDLERATENEANRGALNRMANRIVRRHPGFVGFMDHALHGDKLDELTAETQAAHQKLEADWEREDASSAA
jgi:Zn-finger nucleic acid-binding protein